jgi:hypothetical protein
MTLAKAVVMRPKLPTEDGMAVGDIQSNSPAHHIILFLNSQVSTLPNFSSPPMYIYLLAVHDSLTISRPVVYHGALGRPVMDLDAFLFNIVLCSNHIPDRLSYHVFRNIRLPLKASFITILGW